MRIFASSTEAPLSVTRAAEGNAVTSASSFVSGCAGNFNSTFCPILRRDESLSTTSTVAYRYERLIKEPKLS